MPPPGELVTDGSSLGDSSCGTVRRIEASGDSYVDLAAPTENFGTGDLLKVDSGTGKGQRTYLRFEVNGLTQPVGEVKLRLRVKNSSVLGPEVYLTAGSWEESGITWDNSPPPSGTKLAAIDNLASGWIELGLGPIVTGNGRYDLVLVPRSDDGADFASKESGDAPALLLAPACLPEPG